MASKCPGFEHKDGYEYAISTYGSELAADVLYCKHCNRSENDHRTKFPITRLGVTLTQDHLTMLDKVSFRMESETNKAGYYFSTTPVLDLSNKTLEEVLDFMWENAKKALLDELFLDK